jgi:aspartyl-tRNA(Asn)/glutamyl-tRNA(Gln) amidotransferase subunit C
MALDRAAMAHIAGLARIEIGEAELEPLRADLSRILDWFAQLSEVDTSEAEAMANVAGTQQPLREDRVTDGDCRAAILENAPRPTAAAIERGFFAVPKVVE